MRDRAGETLPLTAAQEGIWTGQQFDPDSPAFNTAEYVEIHGPVDVPRFEAAVRRAVGESDTLNVVFGMGDDGSAWQRFRPARPWPVHVVDVQAEADPLAAALAWMHADLATPVDLRTDLLFCQALFRIGPEHFLWYQRVHHIVLDGYGLSLVARRVAEIYTALMDGREPPEHGFGSLRSVAEDDRAYLESAKFTAAREHWVARSAGRPAPVVLANRTGTLARSVIRVDDHLGTATVDALKAAAEKADSTWSEALTATFAAYLHRMTGARELVLALPVMARLGSVSLRVPCMTTNVVPLWLQVDPATTLVELATQVAAELRAGRPHLRYRYEQLRRDLKLVASDRKLFGPSVNIMPFDYGLNFAGHRGVVHNVSAGLVEDLVLHVYDRADGSGLRIVLDANPNCYDTDEIIDHLHRFLTFLGRATAVPDEPVAEVDLLVGDERWLLLEKWNDTAGTLSAATVPDLLAAQAAVTPTSTALVACDATLSFDQLNARANRLARLLVARGAGPDRYVALLLPRTSDAIVALFAVLKAGAAYVPIDPDYPAKRVCVILADCEPVVLLTTEELRPDAGDDVPVLLVDASSTATALAEQSDVDIDDAGRSTALRPGHAACLIYTSGSTGTPKGVVIEHRGLVNLFHHHREELIRPEARGAARRAALTASLSFDTSWEGLLWLLDGHELHFVDDDRRREPAAMLDYIAEQRIDFLDITPTYAEELISVGLLTDTRHRPAVLALGGEAAGPALWTALRAAPEIAAYNLYGPTECTVDTLHCRLADSADPIVGRPLANTRAYVLDEARRLVPPGVVGELYFGGVPVARGYHNRPQLTAERFVDDPYGAPGARMYCTGDLARWRPDGRLEFLGRADDQVKVRGFRIELGEIEAVLAAHPGVAQATVVPREDPPGPQRLVGYVVPEGAPASDVPASDVPASDVPVPDASGLRQFVAELLPDYMVPPAYVLLERIPRNTNGKLDREALPAPDLAATVAGRAPRDHREMVLCKMFAELLGLPDVSIDDDFFSLGGHSLLVARLIGSIRDEFGERIGIRTVFEAPTVAKLAPKLGTDTAGTADRADTADRAGTAQAGGGSLDVLLPLRTRGSRPPLFCVAPATGLAWCYAGLLGSLPDQPVYGLQSHAITRSARRPETVAEVAADYLRRIREIRPEGPYHLLGWSFGGLVAHEVAVQLEAAGQQAGVVALLDSYPFPPACQDRRALTERDYAVEVLGQAGIPATDALGRLELGKLLREHGNPLGDLDDARLNDLYEAFVYNSDLGAAWTPGRILSEVQLFEATVDKTPDWPGPETWKSHVDGQVRVHRLDCTHNGMAGPRPLARIGAVLAGLLGRPGLWSAS